MKEELCQPKAMLKKGFTVGIPEMDLEKEQLAQVSGPTKVRDSHVSGRLTLSIEFKPID